MTFDVPASVAKNAVRGLTLVDSRHDGNGLTVGAISRAAKLAAREPLALRGDYSIERMRDWFARHIVDRRPGWEHPPTPGYVAWLLWGGDEGKDYVDDMIAKHFPEKLARIKRRKR